MGMFIKKIRVLIETPFVQWKRHSNFWNVLLQWKGLLYNPFNYQVFPSIIAWCNDLIIWHYTTWLIHIQEGSIKCFWKQFLICSWNNVFAKWRKIHLLFKRIIYYFFPFFHIMLASLDVTKIKGWKKTRSSAWKTQSKAINPRNSTTLSIPTLAL